MSATDTTTRKDHCECCGSTEAEDLYNGDQGYTACCNELVCHGDTTVTYRETETGTTGTGCCAGSAWADLETKLGHNAFEATMVTR